MSNKLFTTMDEISRHSIVTDIDTNIFVEAGAGSGKTTMLVNRMVAMIEAGKPVEKICAITFTKNAALEFYDRFQAKLIERSNPNNHDKVKRAGDLQEPTDLTRERCTKALENIDLCFMGTIDSFCSMILSEHPTEANIPSEARLISDKEANNLYKKFYIDVRNGIYGKQLEKLANRFSMFFWNDEDTFALLISEIMDRRNVNFVYDDRYCIDFFKCFSKDRDDIKKVLDTFNKDLKKLILPLKKDDDRDPIEVYKDASEILQKGWHYNYLGVELALKTISNLTYEGSCAELGFTNEGVVRDIEGSSKVSLNISDENNPSALLYKLKNYKYQNTLKFLLACVEELEKYMRQQGKFTFFDYLYYLRNMLEKDAHNSGQLIKYIYDRHSYFLIDEFQDTNPMQAEVFFYLSAENPNQKSWKECKPKPGSLFIVGDPKQSIYRFRSADVSSYLSIKELFKEDAGINKYLVNNFRSKSSLKSYFNDVFEDLMSEESSEQSKYLDIENVNGQEEDEFNGIYSYESYSDSLLADYPDMEDNNRIALIVKSLVNNPKYQIIEYDKTKENYKQLRPIKYNDFMIIFSTKKNISKCINVFKQERIPTRVEGRVLFEENIALKAIVNLYYSLINCGDIVSLISVLYGPLFGFNENDLTLYKKNNGKIILDINNKYDESNVGKALHKLAIASSNTYKYTPSSLFEYIIDEYRVYNYLPCDELEVVYYTLELLRTEESSRIVTHYDALDYLNELIEGESGLERCLNLKQNSDAVHISNLHKVKGLEAPIVILTKAGSSKNTPTVRVEYTNGKPNGYITAIYDKNSDSNHSFSIIDSNEYKEYVEKEIESLKKENDRLVYVAATRARNVLIVNNPKRAGKNGPVGTSNKWKALLEKAQDDIFNILDNYEDKDENLISVKARDLYEKANITDIKCEESYSFKQPSDIKSDSKLVDNNYDNIDHNKESYSTLMGTMVHRLMEMIIMSKDSLNKETIINDILTKYVTIEFSNQIEIFKSKLNKVYDVIHNGGFIQKGNASQDILNIVLNADSVYSEIPFTYKKEDIIYNGIIDLIYEKNGKLHIIDWKTNKDDNNLDEHYKQQLEAYKDSVKTLLGKEVEDALIYHIDIQ